MESYCLKHVGFHRLTVKKHRYCITEDNEKGVEIKKQKGRATGNAFHLTEQHLSGLNITD